MPQKYTPEQKAKRNQQRADWDKGASRPRERVLQKHRARILAITAEYRKRNPEKVKALAIKNRAKYKIEKPDYYNSAQKKWRKKNPESAKAAQKRWWQSHPEKVATQGHLRRARKNKATTADCSEKIALLRRACFCHWCCARLSDSNRSIDHVTPIARGGSHCPDNLVAACRSCNSSKNDRLISEWTWEMAA